MADFVAVLKKTIGALEHNTPEMREKVFDKARAAIENKLAAIDPPPPVLVADRQRAALEQAISAIRAEYAEPVPDEFDDLNGIFDSDEDELTPESAPEVGEELLDEAVEDDLDDTEEPVPAVAAGRLGGSTSGADPVAADKTSPTQAKGSGALLHRPPAKRNRRSGLMVAAAVALVVVIGGAGYAFWVGPDRLAGLFGAAAPTEVAAVESEDAAATESETAAEEASDDQVAAAEPAQVQQSAATEPEKFTQRLLPDGNEIDEGPAGEERRIGEGTSVAGVTGASDEQPASGTGPSGAQVPVGQRAIFYEQSTSSAEGSAESGSIVWSLVRESPGGETAPEPAIRAEVTIPGHSLQLRMTIRRNADRTLPAGHIVELIFLTPENFAGGAIDNVLRVTMKETEEDTGVPLIGIPAKIADGFFLFALSDSPSEMEVNVDQLRRQSWIDIPIVYRSGRRALMTVEKGISGERVFDEAIDAWRQGDSG